MVLFYRHTILQQEMRKDRYWIEKLMQSALVPVSSEYKPDAPDRAAASSLYYDGTLEQDVTSFTKLAQSEFTPFDITLSYQKMDIDLLALAPIKQAELKRYEAVLSVTNLMDRGAYVAIDVSFGRERVREVNPVSRQDIYNAEATASKEKQVLEPGSSEIIDTKAPNKPYNRAVIVQIPEIEITEEEQMNPPKEPELLKTLHPRPYSAPPAIDYDWEKLLVQEFAQNYDESQKAEESFVNPPEISVFVPSNLVRPKPGRSKHKSEEKYYEEKLFNPEAEKIVWVGPSIKAQPIGLVERLKLKETKSLLSKPSEAKSLEFAEIPVVELLEAQVSKELSVGASNLELLQAEPVLNVAKLEITGTSAVNIKSEPGLRDLIQAIYDNDFDEIERILDGREHLLDKYVMQAGKIEDEEEFGNAQLLATNGEISTWLKLEDNRVFIKDLPEIQVAIDQSENSDLEDEGETDLFFGANIDWASSRKVLKAKFSTTSKSKTDYKEAEKDNFDSMFQNHTSPLHLSVILGHEKATYALLKNGADPNLQDLEGYTPMHYAVMQSNNNVVAILYSKFDTINENLRSYRDKETATELAAYLGEVDIFNCLMPNNADLISLRHLKKAMLGKSSEMVKTILENKVFAAKLSEGHAGSILTHAAKIGTSEIFEVALEFCKEKGQNGLFQDQVEQNIFHHIFKASDALKKAEMMKAYVGKAAFSHLMKFGDSHHDTPLHSAAKENHMGYSSLKYLAGGESFSAIQRKQNLVSKFFNRKSKTDEFKLLNNDGVTPDQIYEAYLIGAGLEETSL